MARYFFDTSAFTKRYHPEIGSARIGQLFEETESLFLISNLVVLETQSAFAMKVRTGELDQSGADAGMYRVFNDLSKGLVTAINLSENHINLARALVLKYGYTRRMRTLDALQLATAPDLHKRELLDVFVVADRLLAEAAQLEGLTVEDPEIV